MAEGSGGSSDIFALVGAFPTHVSGFLLPVTSACLGIGCILHWNGLDSPVSVVLGAFITEKRVSFLIVLAEGPRLDFD